MAPAGSQHTDALYLCCTAALWPPHDVQSAAHAAFGGSALIFSFRQPAQ